MRGKEEKQKRKSLKGDTQYLIFPAKLQIELPKENKIIWSLFLPNSILDIWVPDVFVWWTI